MKKTNNKDEFFRQFHARARQYADAVNEGKMPESYAAMELLAAVYSARELRGSDLRSSYPVADWRKNTVEVPVALLQPVIEGWMRYAQQNGKVSLERAMGISAPAAGASSVVKSEKKDDRDRRLANAVVKDLLETERAGSRVSLEAACLGVAEAEECSLRIVQRAHQKFGREIEASSREVAQKLGMLPRGS